MSDKSPLSDNSDRTIIPAKAMAAAKTMVGSDVLPVGTRLGEFEITGLVGQGGFGIVYLAEDHSLQRKVALKEYMPSALAARTGHMTVSVKSDRHAETFSAGLKSFINEARLLAQFDHPSLVKVYRFWEANGTAYMVMPFYEGITLKETLRSLGGPPDERWLKDLLRPLLDALSLMHHEQCFHRDIAPDNILILKGGRPLLLDFGAARRVIGDMTHALTVILKPGYAPVEQYAEMPDMKQGAWTDIYALVSVVYFAITGKAPVPSVARVMSDPLEPLSKVAAGRYSAEFLKGIDKGLAVRPNERPQNVVELRALWGLGDRRQDSRGATPTIAQDLPMAGRSESLARRETETQPNMGRTEISTKSAKKRPIASYAIAGVLLIALIGAGSFFLFGPKEEEKPAVTAKVESPPAPKPAAAPAPVAETEKTPAPEAAEKTSPPVPPPSPHVDKPFSPGQMLDDVFEGRNRVHAVTASAEKAQVRIGRDNLRFSISSSKPGYVYVLVIGTNRSDFDLLFPNAVDKSNRIKPGQTLKLPSRNWPMKAQGPAGTNQFIALVSDEPRDFNALGPTSEDIFKKFPLAVGEQLYKEYIGATPLFAGKAVCASGTECSNSYGAAVFSIEEIAGQTVAQETSPAPAPPKAPQVVVKEPRPPVKQSTVAAPAVSSPTMESKSRRCSDILERASLGESLTPDEQIILKRDCR